MRAFAVRFAAITTMVVVPFAACGSGSSTSSSTSSSSASGAAAVTVHAKDALKFDKDSYDAKSGQITIDYVNDGSLPHTLLIEGQPDFKKLSIGTKDTGSVHLTAGTYTIFCDVAGHRGAGMEAKLVVS
jgi:plastocyanin